MVGDFMARGIGYIGSSDIQTSTANQEIIPSTPLQYNLYKFQFANNTDCHVRINNDEDILFIRANQWFEMDNNDAPIFSFKIVDAGIQFNWVGAYA
jgi:SPX domain protein involved in polyphosphate accumulation